jgi:tetratricopeptide (TPR) repeat protein
MPAYDAFISYSHARDKAVASALQSVIQKVGKPWYRRRASRVFRDDTSLSATPHLWPSIEKALGQSRFLILLASPEAAASHWVQQEVAFWLEKKSPETLLIALTSGKLAWDRAEGDFCWSETTPLPAVLRGRFKDEPRWIDLTTCRTATVRDPGLIALAVDFASAIRGVPKEDLLSEEVRQQRKALTLAWSAAGSLLVLAGLAIWFGVEATRQTRIAEAQRDRAERSLSAATNTANGLVFDFAQRFADTTGVPASLVKDILERSLKLQDQLFAAGETNDDLLASRSIALNETAYTLLVVGETPAAVAAAEKSLAIMRDLVRSDPRNGRWQTELVVNLNRIADVKLEAGDQAAATAALDEAITIARARVAAFPGDASQQVTLGRTLLRLCDVKLQAGDADAARQTATEALAMLRPFAANKDDSEAVRNVAVGLERLASAESLEQRYKEALAALEESRDLHARRAVAATDAGAQRDRLVVMIRIGDVKQNMGDLTGALDAFRQALAVARKLAWDASNADAQDDLAYSLASLGDAERAAGDPDGAIKSLDEGVAIRRKLAAADGTNAFAQSQLATALERVARARLDGGSIAEAAIAYDESLAIRRKLAGEAGNFEARRDFGVALMEVSGMKIRKGDLAGAASVAEEMLAVFRELEKDSGSSVAGPYLMLGLARLGDVRIHGGDKEGAQAAFEQARSIGRELAADKDNADAQRNLSEVLESLGDVQRFRKDFTGALASYAECATLRDLLAARSGTEEASKYAQACRDKIEVAKSSATAAVTDPGGARSSAGSPR